MNSGPLLFLGTFLAFAISWFGFVLTPQLQLGRAPQTTNSSNELYPTLRAGTARQGQEVYRSEGCYNCHTLQVRPVGFGADKRFGWNGRASLVQSVAEDYLYDQTVMPGSQRIGPDLTNIGLRQTNSTWLYVHLYDARLNTPHSVMPPYKYLFEKRPLARDGKASPEALPVADVESGSEVVPTDEARQLVAYLLSLHSDSILYQTPLYPRPTTNAAPAVASTNATPASATNAPSK